MTVRYQRGHHGRSPGQGQRAGLLRTTHGRHQPLPHLRLDTSHGNLILLLLLLLLLRLLLLRYRLLLLRTTAPATTRHSGRFQQLLP